VDNPDDVAAERMPGQSSPISDADKQHSELFASLLVERRRQISPGVSISSLNDGVQVGG